MPRGSNKRIRPLLNGGVQLAGDCFRETLFLKTCFFYFRDQSLEGLFFCNWLWCWFYLIEIAVADQIITIAICTDHCTLKLADMWSILAPTCLLTTTFTPLLLTVGIMQWNGRKIIFDGIYDVSDKNPMLLGEAVVFFWKTFPTNLFKV